MNKTVAQPIFLTGAVMSASVDQLNDLQIIKEKLEAADFKVISAHDDLPTGDSINNRDAIDLYKENRRKAADKCKTIVYLENYQMDEMSINDVRRAKSSGSKMVKSVFDFFKEFVKTNPQEATA